MLSKCTLYQYLWTWRLPSHQFCPAAPIPHWPLVEFELSPLGAARPSLDTLGWGCIIPLGLVQPDWKELHNQAKTHLPCRVKPSLLGKTTLHVFTERPFLPTLSSHSQVPWIHHITLFIPFITFNTIWNDMCLLLAWNKSIPISYHSPPLTKILTSWRQGPVCSLVFLQSLEKCQAYGGYSFLDSHWCRYW